MICRLAVPSAVVLASLLLAAPGGSPPSTETISGTTEPAPGETTEPGIDERVEQEGSPEFERKLAELAFALFLGNELDVDAGTYSCTEPSSLAVGETITCFTLIGSDRVVVAVDGADRNLRGLRVRARQRPPDRPSRGRRRRCRPTSTVSRATTTTLPTPILVTTVAPLSQADRDLLAYGEQINAGLRGARRQPDLR